MASNPKIAFASSSLPEHGVAVVLTDYRLGFSGISADLIGRLGDFERIAKAGKFTGKAGSTLDILAPSGTELDRLIVFGLGRGEGDPATEWVRTGGQVLRKIGAADHATVLIDVPPGLDDDAAEAASQMALGARLRAYTFDRYKTKKKDDEDSGACAQGLTLALSDVDRAQELWKRQEAIADGVDIARDLVNEPSNILFPEEFANRASKLVDDGIEIEILDEDRMAELGMGAILGVGQGSENESRIVIMRWNGAGDDSAPIAFVGKGVTFDTGGISIKPSGSMEDMKGDMAGAACVTGLMHALARRGAKVNAVGLIGLAENMPDGAAQRPGDIVTSMSGQTIEIINTDAEGRLVLGDVLWYAQDRFKPVAMIDLATLTGAILVALGQEHGGLFSNNDELSDRLLSSGKATGERVWRMPLDPAYDKIIDSKFADMKNSGGRHGGSITAAQFLQRFVNGTPWAHLDIAGTGMGSLQSDLNQSWGSGWGVRLLDRLVADHYES
ncbi:leucyl aminopeptidase [Terrihabitans sp. B22-R8]|uniref:leucyl aminopeptidase n=1 Tax=Terrihabitans sp. B22-R8 TaxID=3425128 RepID=UPI00403CFC23